MTALSTQPDPGAEEGPGPVRGGAAACQCPSLGASRSLPDFPSSSRVTSAWVGGPRHAHAERLLATSVGFQPAPLPVRATPPLRDPLLPEPPAFVCLVVHAAQASAAELPSLSLSLLLLALSELAWPLPPSTGPSPSVSGGPPGSSVRPP